MRFPPQPHQVSKNLLYPAITDPVDLFARPERHVRNSIATLSVAIATALAQLSLDVLGANARCSVDIYDTVRLGLFAQADDVVE